MKMNIKKIFFHISFISMFIFFALFNYYSSGCFFSEIGCWGSLVSVLQRVVSIVVLVLSFLVYLSYAILYYFGTESLFLKVTVYVAMFLYLVLFIAHRFL
jgi:hypothetical protein